MRTAIFVYEPTTVTVTTCESNLQLVSFDGKSTPVTNGSELMVGPGIYKIESSSQVSVASASRQTRILFTTSDKDQWPDPTLVAQSTLAGTSPKDLQAFFTIEGGKEFKLNHTAT